MSDPQERMKKVVGYMQHFMDTYDNQPGYLSYSDDTFIDDILYGLGVALGGSEHEFSDGFRKFKDKLRAHLAKDGSRYVSQQQINGFPLVKMFREQRDELYDALFELVRLKSIKEEIERRLNNNAVFKMEGLLAEYEKFKEPAWAAARAAIAQVPSYFTRLDNICQELGISLEQLTASLSSISSSKPLSLDHHGDGKTDE